MLSVSTILTTAVVGLAIASWLFMGPSSIGGPVDYMITDGVSMRPYVTRGDLAVVRVGRRGEVGDVVAYHNGLIGRRVLHRVIGIQGERFILKGDNNSWVDRFQPTQDELIGTLWFRVPHAGKVVGWLQSPLHAAALVGLGTVMTSFTGTRSKRRAWRGTSAPFRGGDPMQRVLLAASGAAGQNGLGILLGIAILAGVASAVLWRLPSEQTTVVQREYAHRGTFGYSAETVIPMPTSLSTAEAGEPSSASPGDLDLATLVLDPTIRALLDVPVATGDPILVTVNPRVDFTFDYRFDTPIEGDVSGTIRLEVVIADINGWKRIFPFAPEQAFSGRQVRIERRDAELVALMDAFPLYQAITGHAPVYYTASIVAVVTLEGLLDGQVIHDTFEPAVTFRVAPPFEIYVETIDTRQFEMLGLRNITIGGGVSDGSPFDTSKVGSIASSTTVPNTLPVLGLDLSIGLLRVATAVAGGIALGIAIPLVVLQRMGARQGEAFAVEALHGGRIVILHEDQHGNTHIPTAYVARIGDLIRLSKHYGSPVLSEEINGDRIYYVREGDHVYAYAGKDR